jgi:AAA+ ATPase superfamily predicted ATPase
MIYSWFNLVYAVRQEIEGGTAVFQAERLNRVLGTAFESLCTEFIAGLNREKGWGYDRIGCWWHKEEEIDIVCLDTGKKRALLCEVKYGKLDGRGAGGVLDGLARKMELTPWSEGWKVEYCVLAGEIRDGENVREELGKERCRCYEMRDIIG